MDALQDMGVPAGAGLSPNSPAASVAMEVDVQAALERLGVIALGIKDQRDALRKALAELLDAFDISEDDLPAHEYEAIVADAKGRARKLLQEK